VCPAPAAAAAACDGRVHMHPPMNPDPSGMPQPAQGTAVDMRVCRCVWHVSNVTLEAGQKQGRAGQIPRLDEGQREIESGVRDKTRWKVLPGVPCSMVGRNSCRQLGYRHGYEQDRSNASALRPPNHRCGTGQGEDVPVLTEPQLLSPFLRTICSTTANTRLHKPIECRPCTCGENNIRRRRPNSTSETHSSCRLPCHNRRDDASQTCGILQQPIAEIDNHAVFLVDTAGVYTLSFCACCNIYLLGLNLCEPPTQASDDRVRGG